MLYDPTPNVSLTVAFPALVNCALPKIAESSQCTALALQKTTVPCASGTLLPSMSSVTVAVSVTAVPATTELPGAMLNVVEVVADTPEAGSGKTPTHAIASRVSRPAFALDMVGNASNRIGRFLAG
jgi:hypothetical protein